MRIETSRPNVVEVIQSKISSLRIEASDQRLLRYTRQQLLVKVQRLERELLDLNETSSSTNYGLAATRHL